MELHEHNLTCVCVSANSVHVFTVGSSLDIRVITNCLFEVRFCCFSVTRVPPAAEAVL